ncbi:MAG TPA: HDOD domain-containing protein [Syntrophobacteraceae bacterium]|nr:HDOD domain-containing protein [Syntrophobacteraceae bacterium]
MSKIELSSPLRDAVGAAQKLPPFPEVVWKVMPLVERMAPVAEIEAVIRFDPVITAKVLVLSRSPSFSRGQKITSLRDAIVLLGQQRLVQVVTAACSSTYFMGEAPGYDLREGELWEHSIATALMTEIVAEHLGWPEKTTAFTAAILHDIGKTILHHFVGAYFESIMALVGEKKKGFLDAEREVLGIDHQQLGERIALRWRLPSPVVTAIGFHHQPRQALVHQQLVSLVYLCDRMASAMGIGCGVDGLMQPNEDDVCIEMGITPRMIERFCADLVDRLGETRRFLSS